MNYFELLQIVVFMDPTVSQCSIVNPSDSSAPPKTFSFDGVYYMESTTDSIYNEISYPLVEVRKMELLLFPLLKAGRACGAADIHSDSLPPG